MATKKPISKTKKAAVKKPVKKAPAKKAPAKKAVKKAAPAKKVVKKVAPAKKAVKKVAPAKKAAPAKKVIKKAAPAKKVVAKAIEKSTPAKKVVAKAPVVKKAATKTAVTKALATPVAKVKAVEVKTVVVKPTEQKAIVVAPPVKIVKETMIEKVKPTVTQRYNDADLQEFKGLIVKKLVDAREELINLQAQILNTNENGTDDTGASFKMLEDGSETLAKEEAANLAARQKKFIEQLEMALIRVENKTYGICRITGKLIAKERLRAVPHTTQSMEAKLKQYRD
jgi:RNA polymerase-binding transcription factor DksA